MNFQEYEQKAITTKCYKDEVAVPYVVLGLCGEVGEFIEKVRIQASEELVLKELGDCLWYIAAIRIEMDLEPLNWPNAKELRYENPAELSGAIAEQIKKWLRDEWQGVGTVIPEARKNKIHNSLSYLLSLFDDWLMETGINVSLEDIAQQNVEKLADRAKRNVIHGSGDLR